MAQIVQFLHSDDIHPIDIVESIASQHEWDFDRVGDDQISMSVEGQWRSYALTLAWSARDEVLRMIASFDMDPPAHREAALYHALNLTNDQVWDGGFTFWTEQRLMVWRYGLVLCGQNIAAPEQINRMVRSAIDSCERFYPSFQLVCWGDVAPSAALDIAMSEAYGRA